MTMVIEQNSGISYIDDNLAELELKRAKSIRINDRPIESFKRGDDGYALALLWLTYKKQLLKMEDINTYLPF